ncbi:2-oxoglutarate dehydrogenase complex dihydrolipoyllysine-residue succinyltransferase [Trichlorobacter ammonificans]|uniref:Dihydrolipoyllysine-residue succinyltransferase component of 2-oxoglutarate dehydrogenase complex n=1 Tax=Trichlorobacter ammonificans TaxID=2916410 RepID=A0ABM9D5E2_9BACT|nr:2-oxoglutarate dehydrogenase complex dihydrolipoyllysine-residue succinyltransferase [Trichlorobacter ammonificans]CAH2030421.1 2-oxoglutarate dehydrogenase complex, dihydrolipoamide acyltransferase (E2) component [Trichlorobacter ammonificans]
MDIRIPTVGESVVEALLARWHKGAGEAVRRDEALCEIETDKITMDIFAEADGVLTISVPAGTTVAVGAVIGRLDPGGATIADSPAPAAAPPAATAQPAAAPPTSPSVRQELREKGLAASQVDGSGPGGRILNSDLAGRQATVVKSEEPPAYHGTNPRGAAQPLPGEERVRMSPLRKRVAERLLQARQQTAMLTTFNEADLAALQAVRAERKQRGAGVGLLPFFVRATVEALRAYPAVNARIDGDDIVYHHFQHLGIAVASDKGLVVPVLKEAGDMGLGEIDAAIAGFVEKIKTNRLAIADLEGGTFTITNGGTYGSMLSTPIINPPQSGVLGMHAIADRPVVRDGQVVIRPVMYLALSYDHRIIDGREAVGFLKLVKERLEDRTWLDGLR